MNCEKEVKFLYDLCIRKKGFSSIFESSFLRDSEMTNEEMIAFCEDLLKNPDVDKGLIVYVGKLYPSVSEVYHEF